MILSDKSRHNSSSRLENTEHISLGRRLMAAAASTVASVGIDHLMVRKSKLRLAYMYPSRLAREVCHCHGTYERQTFWYLFNPDFA
jgi:hypothetical protein